MEQLRALVIEDDLKRAELLAQELIKAGFLLQWQRVYGDEDLNLALEKSNWDVVLSNYSMPGYCALDALELLKRKRSQIPLVILSENIGEEAAASAIKAGATDLILKSNLSRISSVIERILKDSALKKTDQALSIVSHDIKNPLNAIQLNIEMALRLIAKAPNPKAHILLTRAVKSTERIKKMIEDLLDQSSLEGGRFRIHIERDYIDSLILDLSEMFQSLVKQKHIHLITIVPNEKTLADFDRERLFQAIANLIGNAIKFTPEEGSITLMLDVNESELQFKVADTGPGIPQDSQRNIFQPYWRGMEHGNHGIGLGLFITKGIVDGHHGTIRLISEEGKGTCFELRIPRWAQVQAYESQQNFAKANTTIH